MSVSTVYETVRNADHFFFGGEWVKPSTGNVIDVYDSTTEEIFFTVAAGARDDVDRAVTAARMAFDYGPWPRMSPKERAIYLEKIADAWISRAEILADTWTAESGVIKAISSGTAAQLAGIFRDYAKMADTFDWEEKHQSVYNLPALLVREPVGVVAAIVPWNAPAMMVAYKSAAALIAGCCLVVKASPEAPVAAYMFAEICREIGLPAGVVNVITAHREESELLVRHPGVDKVSFTGSTSAGRKIAAACGERIARCTLELGGKSAAVILDDYDIATAAEYIASAATMLTGQVCGALTRVIVSAERHDQFADALTASFSAVKVGNPYEDATQMGPLASAAQRTRVEDMVAKGKEQGARLTTGGGRPSHLNRGYYFEPTVFASVDNSWSIAQDEIFGPVLCVIPARDEEQAIEIANDSIYGLNASVFTNDVERAYNVGRRLRSGTVGHNGLRGDFSIAFGGFKQSGIGREGGLEGIYPYTEAKTMVFDNAPKAAL